MDLATLGIVSTIGGAIISASGASQSANAQAQASAYQAQVARNNQIIAQQYAEQSRREGEIQAQTKETETAQRIGAVRAAAGAAGLDTASGSPLRLQDDTKALGSLDAQTIRYNAAKQAYGYEVRAAGFEGQSRLDTMASENARSAGSLGALGAIISGGASVSDKWAKFKATGVPFEV